MSEPDHCSRNAVHPVETSTDSDSTQSSFGGRSSPEPNQKSASMRTEIETETEPEIVTGTETSEVEWDVESGEVIRTVVSPFRGTRHLIEMLSSDGEYETVAEARSDPAVWIVVCGAGLVAAIELTGLLVILTPFALPGIGQVVLNAYPIVGLIGLGVILQPLASLWVASAVRIGQRGIHSTCYHAIESWFGKREI